jgi:phytoene dehydrogenase-like protein
MPEEPVLELVLPSVEKTAHQLGSRLPLHARVWPVPLGPAYDREALIRTVTQMIERHVPGFGGGIASCDAAPPDAYQPSLARLSAAAETRVATAIRGLYVCGSDTEPADATSGRSARHAARAAIAYRRNGATA